MSGNEYDVSAKVVVNATGPFADKIRQMDDPDSEALMRPSSGTHVLVESKYLSDNTGILVPKTKDGRVIFLLPWEGSTLLGTTETVATPDDHARSTKKDVEYLLAHANEYLNANLTMADVKSIWTGWRPLWERHSHGRSIGARLPRPMGEACLFPIVMRGKAVGLC
ncbi:MAG: FAD-dependent oxidoreductase [Planctomycetes bacterium]|nr:FAD-dependent oxidoreductase [Planctomycetota bacterium]